MLKNKKKIFEKKIKIKKKITIKKNIYIYKKKNKMKTFNILSLVASVLAIKVSANLWKQPVVYDDGKPIPVQKTDPSTPDDSTNNTVNPANLWEQPVVYDDGKPIPVQTPVPSTPDDSTNNTVNPANLWEQPIVYDDGTPIPVQTTTPANDYMSKLNVVNICPAEAIAEQSGVEYPTPKKIYYHSKTTNSDRPLNIILPPNYTESKKYPVLYLLHGIMGNEDSMLDTTMGSITIPTNLAKEGKAKEMIIVLPNEYAPEGGNEVPPAFNQEFFDGYDNFINDLVDSIMPYMEANYSILTGRENTAVCGFSMGGRNSLYIGYKRSDLFGYVGAFSPAPGVTPGTDFSGYHKGLFTEDTFRAEIPPIVTLISCGTHDSVVGQFPKSYHDILTRNNQEHIWFEVPDADHDGKAVSAGYYNFISAAFGALN